MVISKAFLEDAPMPFLVETTASGEQEPAVLTSLVDRWKYRPAFSSAVLLQEWWVTATAGS